MNKILIACVAALSLFSIASCKKKGGGAAGDYVAKMEGWKTDMCKCKAGDTACSQKVLDDQKKYADEMAKTVDKDAKPDPAEAAEMAKKMEPIMAEYSKCMTSAMTPAAATDDKKPDDSAKTVDKKPDEVKADDKKPDEVKADDKKPDDKKPDDKKDDKKGGW